VIKNFNFYDIYGYLIPGLAVLGVFWLPFGLAAGAWPAQEWSSALIVIVLAYIVGHLLQTFTHIALPDQFGGRYPSDTLLDAKDKRFTHEFKRLLCEKINEVFKLKADYHENGAGAVMESRGIAFFLCRSALMQCKAGAYAEQAQGMYVLARGLSAAFALGAALHFGWAVSSLWQNKSPDRPGPPLFLGVGVLAAIVVALIFWRRERHASDLKKTKPQLGTAVSLVTAVLLLGVVLGHDYLAVPESDTKPHTAEGQATCCVIIDTCCVEKAPSGAANRGGSGEITKWVPFQRWLLGLVLAEILFSVKLYDTFKRFAGTFAESVYRDFLALGICGKPGTADAEASGDGNGE
jgi:hypothetical protein